MDKGPLSVIMFMVVFIVYFLFGAIFQGLITSILFTVIIFLIFDLGIGYSLLIGILLSGVIQSIFNFRVFMESIIVMSSEREGGVKYMKEIMKLKKEGEKYRVSVPIYVGGKYYRIIEFAEYFFDPRAKNKDDLKGFTILSDEDSNKEVELNIKRKVLGIYLFWRHIYFNSVLEPIPLKPNSKKLFRFQAKFQERFKQEIMKRKEAGYSDLMIIKNKSYSTILRELDDEVLSQYPFVKEKLKIEIDIFDGLYALFTQPSDVLYLDLAKKIEKVSNLSKEENKFWQHRLQTWRKLANYFNIKIENLPGPNFKKAGASLALDFLKYTLSKKEPIISEETIKDLIVETSKIPRKRILKSLNNYIVLHKSGIDAIKLNIEVNKSFNELAKRYHGFLENPPIEKIRG